MSVIENFAELSEQEQRAFAEALIKTINSENTFSSEVDFTVDEVESDDMTGCLFIGVTHEPTITVERPATWTCNDSDEAYSTPDDAEYFNSTEDDVKDALNTKEVVIDGYRIILNEVSDAGSEETIEVEVDSISNEDSGIGHYEFWGESGYDSHPYCEVEGTLVEACSCYIVFEVIADTPAPVETDED